MAPRVNWDGLDTSSNAARTYSESDFQTATIRSKPSTRDNKNRLAIAGSDAALGIGVMANVAQSSTISRMLAPAGILFKAAIPRVAGGIGTLAFSGPRLYESYQADRAEGDSNYSLTRRETFLTGTSIAASCIAGAATGAVVGALALTTAPVWIIGAAAGTGMAAVGYAAYKTREFFEGWYDGR